MLNGILIDLDSKLLRVNRNVYSLTDWAGEVGGFSKTIGVMIAVLYPILSMSSLESFLILRLFKQPSNKEVDSPDIGNNPSRKLLKMSQDAVAYRKPFENRSRNSLLNWFKYFGCGSNYNKEDFNYMKAQHKLASELDIKRILTSLRFFRSAIRFLTTRSERKLIRMQAQPLIADEGQNRQSELLKPASEKDLDQLLRLDECSSDFDELKQDKFLRDLQAKSLKLKNKHLRLVCGVFESRQENIDEILGTISGQNVTKIDLEAS